MARPSLLQTLSNGQPNSLGSNVVSQFGAIAGLKAKDEWFPEVLRISRHNQGLIHAAVQQIAELTMPIFPSHGNFVAIDCSRAGISPTALCDGFLRRDIQIRHAGYHTDRYADRFIKVSTTVPTQHTQQFCDVLPAVVTEALASQPATEKHY